MEINWKITLAVYACSWQLFHVFASSTLRFFIHRKCGAGATIAVFFSFWFPPCVWHIFLRSVGGASLMVAEVLRGDSGRHGLCVKCASKWCGTVLLKDSPKFGVTEQWDVSIWPPNSPYTSTIWFYSVATRITTWRFENFGLKKILREHRKIIQSGKAKCSCSAHVVLAQVNGMIQWRTLTHSRATSTHYGYLRFHFHFGSFISFCCRCCFFGSNLFAAHEGDKDFFSHCRRRSVVRWANGCGWMNV